MLQKKGARLGNINTQLYALAEANLGNLAAVGIRDVTTELRAAEAQKMTAHLQSS
jgi:hypothetical protein